MTYVYTAPHQQEPLLTRLLIVYTKEYTARGMQSTTPIEECFPRIDQRHRNGLARLGIHTARDLLLHLPRRYLDITTDDKGTVVTGTITAIHRRCTGGRRRVMIAEATITADNDRIRAVWFHQPYIAQRYQKGDVVTLTGTWSGKGRPYLANPVINKPNDTTNLPDELTPFYPETQHVSSRWLQAKMHTLLSDSGIKDIEDPIPLAIRKRLNLPNLYDTLMYTHKPRTEDEYEAGRKRLIFEHVFLMQIHQQLNRQKRVKASAHPLPVSMRSITSFMNKRFPFTPTKGQVSSIKEIVQDIQKHTPMARLLEGDVGSGKTAVAAAVIHGVVVGSTGPNGPQVVYLAPTDVLARQQFETLTELFSDTPITIGYLSGKTCKVYPSKLKPNEATDAPKSRLKTMAASGELTVTIGTHALIQKDITFANLSLTIIDEQHRFGVAQRKQLVKATQGRLPHQLSMTATPIPRTLALALYGDLDISVLREMPKGRKRAKTAVVSSSERNKKELYRHLRQEIDRGHQAYVLCPRIEKDGESPLRSLEEEYHTLKEQVFPDKTVAMLHGKLLPKEKQETMDAFYAGSIDIVVCTTVIEIGVNVPNATVMIILHAERFGLAQLHQIRGRVTRSTKQPYCYAVTDSSNSDTLRRLRVFATTHNGFDLAEQDLTMRGSGDLAGLRQSGVPDMVAEGLKNPILVAHAQKEAKNLIKEDATLSAYPALCEQLKRQAAEKA